MTVTRKRVLRNLLKIRFSLDRKGRRGAEQDAMIVCCDRERRGVLRVEQSAIRLKCLSDVDQTICPHELSSNAGQQADTQQPDFPDKNPTPILSPTLRFGALLLD